MNWFNDCTSGAISSGTDAVTGRKSWGPRRDTEAAKRFRGPTVDWAASKAMMADMTKNPLPNNITMFEISASVLAWPFLL